MDTRKRRFVTVPNAGRRKFLLSAALTGAATSVWPQPISSKQLLSPVTPEQAAVIGLQAIDSLSFAPEFLPDIYPMTACALTEVVVVKTESLAERYQEIIDLVDQLESEAPELKDTPGITNLKEAGRLGKESVAKITNLANTHDVLTEGFVRAVYSVFDGNDLLKSELNLSTQEKSITLSPKAVRTLRTLLSRLRSLRTYVLGTNTAANDLGKSLRTVYTDIGRAKVDIFAALSALGKRQKAEALQKINDVKGILNGIDLMYLTGFTTLPDDAKKKCEKENRNERPCELILDYLESIEVLIAKEIAHKDAIGDSDYQMRFVQASFHPQADVFDLAPLMGEPLGIDLVENTQTRRDSAASVIRPFLRYRDGKTRIEKFTEALKYVRPQGKDDQNESSRRSAATKIQKILQDRGW